MKFSIFSVIHGKKPKIKDLFLIYTIPLFFAILFIFYWVNYNWELTKTQYFISFLLLWDIIGWIISNLTYSTNQFYRSKKLRTIGVIIHFFQPLIFTIFITNNWILFWFLYIFTLITSLIIININRKKSPALAILFVIIWILIINSFIFTIPVYASWFGPAFLFKIIFCFSVYHKQKESFIF